MSTVHGAMIGHVVKRGIAAAQDHFQAASPDYIAQLQQDAQVYEQASPEMQVKPVQVFGIFIVGILAFLILASIDYTLGDLVATLTMIESPSSTAIIEPKPPAYADVADAPLEKELFLPAETDTDVEITVVNHKPITANITSTIGHLRSVGGFFARWRGLGVSTVYHFLHNFATNLLSHLFGFGIAGQALLFIVSSLFLVRLHLLWTHTMIARPNSMSLRQRVVPLKQCRRLILPTVVFAAAQQATFLLPVALAATFGLPQMHPGQVAVAAQNKDCSQMVSIGLRVLAVLVTAIIVAIAVLLPASVTLTRIEATLLPEGMETIVPFDRESIMGDIDTTVRGGCKALFVQAWRSFDRSARLRLLKLYAKMVLIQFGIATAAVYFMLLQMMFIGVERLAILYTAAHAQLKLMVIEAAQNAHHAA